MTRNCQVLKALTESDIFRDYVRAWQVMTAMPLHLVSTDLRVDSAVSVSKRSPLCVQLSGNADTCTGCLQSRTRLVHDAAERACTRTCAYGLCETAVPVRVGNETVAFLVTGEVFREPPSEARFEEFAEKVRRSGRDPKVLRDAYFRTLAVGADVQRAALQMLAIFAQHLASVANQIVIDSTHAEPPLLQRTKAYINEHLTDEVSLSDLARQVGSSKFYICRLFKRSMDMTFTEYRSRSRVERAKELLLEPNRRVSEVAYEVGFQSLTHFNRIFRRFVGTSPTDFREHLAHT